MSGVVNPKQLRMFMTAQELHDMHSIDVMQTPESRFGGAWPTMKKMWAVKKRENKQDGLDKSVARYGVHVPVELSVGRDFEGEVISGGHHRIQAAFDANPQSWVPVEHTDFDQPIQRRSYTAPSIPEWEDIDRFPSYP